MAASRSRYLTSFDPKLVEVTPKNVKRAVAAANELLAAGEVEGVNIHGFVDVSLEPLARLVPVKRLHFQRCLGLDLAPLYGQTKLDSLVVTPDPMPVDLARFSSVRDLSLSWHPATTGLATLRKLRSVALWKTGTRFRDVASFELSPTVRVLQLTQARLRSLAGIERLPQLEDLQLAYLREPVDLSPVAGAKKLTEFSLDNARQPVRIESLAKCAQLRRLSFDRCGAIETLGWMRHLRKLRQFVILGTDVADRDFGVLARLPDLKSFSADYRRTFRPPIARLKTMLHAEVHV